MIDYWDDDQIGGDLIGQHQRFLKIIDEDHLKILLKPSAILWKYF